MTKSLFDSLDVALAAGGDRRLLIGDDGLNKYGCASHPRAAIPLGSCTSSSPSPRSFAAAARLQEALQVAVDPRVAAQNAFQAIRQRLRRELNIRPDIDIALAPSGTDTEIIAAALAAGPSDRPLVNIIVGPNEVGSGTIPAACVRHYDSLVPSGAIVTPGDPIDDALADRIHCEVVRLREDDGAMVEEKELDRRVTRLVDDARRQGANVLVHIVAHSKTGMHAPSLACVTELRKRHPELVVLVDAAQGRFSRKGMIQSLTDGHLFMITGSKFFGGPPFSGAILIPRQMSPRARGIDRFPRGFGHYLTAVEMPTSWKAIRESLPSEPNYPALLRWAAAMEEIETYYSVPGPARLEVLRYFESVVPAVFDASERIELLSVYPPIYGEDRLLQSKTTVFNFRVRASDGHFLDRSELARLHRMMNGDVSSEFPAVDPGITSTPFHLGQPVAIGKTGFALRVALGTRLIEQVSLDERLGQTFDARREWLRSQLECLQQKIDLVANHVVTPQAVIVP